MAATLQELLDRQTARAAAELVRPDGSGIRCLSCGHRCLIQEGRRGVCQVRHVENGELRVPSGYVAGLAVDPIEKKPFFHVLPGESALSFGMLGCDLHCAYCQNWNTSQSLRDADADQRPRSIRASEIVELCVRESCPVLVSTYNEPLITAEWSRRIFELAKEEGILTGFVSNGNATPEVLDYLRPVTDLYKIDLKGFDDRHYRQLGCPLGNILDGIVQVHERGFWLEVVTLVVPGFNDSDRELAAIARFLAELSLDIPWHVTAFHPDYRMREQPGTPIESLRRARGIGREQGLRHVYAGNVPGRIEDAEDSFCSSCDARLIERSGYRPRVLALEDGRCARCGEAFPGVHARRGRSR